MSFGPASTGSGDRALDGPRPGRAGTGTALVQFVPSAPKRASLSTGTMIWAAGLALALGAGGLGLDVIHNARTAGAAKVVQQADASDKLQRLQDEISRLKGSIDTMRAAADGAKPDEPLRGLKKSVDGLKQEIEQIKSNGATLAQLASKLDKPDHDPSQKLADIMARLDKLDRDPKDKGADGSNQKLAEVASRLDRMERQVSSQTPTGSLPAPGPAKAAVLAPSLAVPAKTAVAAPSVPAPSVAALTPLPAPMPPSKPAAKVEVSAVAATDPKPAAVKPATVDGWVLRDVYDGMALVEARRGGLREVAPGEYLPGAGEVRSIERRGRSWVVLTSRGVIENGTW